ncbi:5'-methylthioadenosine/S-adenosylhomocysteine nucleosidase family protein [Aspergillus lucknowensis]|uniref:Pfs domain protein n=1 Tax=Aspergillus lucknowensis TaxID=176173 RepID=A0ABR4LRC3_9EURO
MSLRRSLCYSTIPQKASWICATPVELEAAVAVLDEIHPPLFHHDYDGNIYELGSIGPHNVVICSTASTVVDYLRFNFPEIKACLWVGIASGMPSRTTDIRLGDVVVSTPNESSPGVIQLDRGKTVADGGFARTAVLRGPSQTLLTAVDTLRALHTQHNGPIISVLSELQAQGPKKWMPPPAVDELFDSTYEHVEGGGNCANCDRTKLVPRGLRNGTSPVIHYGLVVSGNQVVRHGGTRDMLQKELGALCFGIGDAGLINDTQCLVIRGICDYADSHKNRAWQSFAAATAAAYAKELLSFVPPSIGDIEPV